MTALAIEIPLALNEGFGSFVGILAPIPSNLSNKPTPEKSEADPLSEVMGTMIGQAAENGMAALDAFLQFDLGWRTSVFRGEVAYDEATEGLIHDNLATWARNSKVLLSVAEALVRFGVEAPAVEALRAKVDEVFAMLTPDDEFFEGEELDRLAGEALEAHRRGETVEFTEMGQ